MVQRSTTHIVKSDSLMEIGLAPLYSEQAVANGMTTAKADLIFASLPYKILHEFQIPVYNAIREKDAEFYKRLKQAGFMLDYGDDDSGLFSEISAARLGLLHRCRRVGIDRQRQHQTEERRRCEEAHGEFRDPE